MSETPNLSFAVKARVGSGSIATLVAERDGQQIAVVRYMIGNDKRRAETAQKWARNETLCGKVPAKKRAPTTKAIESALEAAELRAQQVSDQRAAENEAAAIASEDAAQLQLEADEGRRIQEAPNYYATPAGITWLKPTQNGEVVVPLTNFNASIVADVVRDDGLETSRLLEIDAILAGGFSKRFTVPVTRFPSMNWVVEELGPRALVYPGMSLKDHARAAIQTLSPGVTHRAVYTHTGWRRIMDEWVYLHSGGAIGPIGPVSGIDTSLPSNLAPYRLPDPPRRKELTLAVGASLEVLRLAPFRITAPILGSVFRSVIEPADFNGALFGHTGVFKTELAAVMQQFFGAGFTARNLPASWSSTGNALETLAFTVKDGILVIDDFAPGGSGVDIARYHREADRVLRAQGNNSGRGRLRPDGELRPTRCPRGLIVTTGEDIPRGESLRARQFIVEVRQGDVDPRLLSQAQDAGGNGLFASAMAGFLQWLAGQLEDARRDLRAEVSRMRSGIAAFSHRRTSDIVAHLTFGLRLFLRFAVAVEAISAREADRLLGESSAALIEGANEQAEYLFAADPARRYVELIRAAIVAGEAHLLSHDGQAPDEASRWGWQLATLGSTRSEWRPRGDCIGWLDCEDAYLEPTSAFRVAQRMAGPNDGLAVGERTVRKRLSDGKWLRSTDPDRGKIVVRKTLQERRREVLHFGAERLITDESAQSAQPALNPLGAAGTRAASEAVDGGSAHEPAQSAPERLSAGPNGPIGPVRERDKPNGAEAPIPDDSDRLDVEARMADAAEAEAAAKRHGG